MASSWPATAYMLHRREVPALLRAPLVHDIARKVGKKPAQVCSMFWLSQGTCRARVTMLWTSIGLLQASQSACDVCRAWRVWW